jgi:hypothetical protein
MFRSCWMGEVVTFTDPRSSIVPPGVTLPRVPNSNGEQDEEEVDKDPYGGDKIGQEMTR